jgi:hypothetical protein
MTQEAKTEADRLKDIYDGLETGNGNMQKDLHPLLIDLVRRIKELEEKAKS